MGNAPDTCQSRYLVPLWDANPDWSLFYDVIPANALALLLCLYVLQRLSTSVSGLCSLAVPVVGVLAA
ncbi:MAG: hypothetical protein ACRETA_06865 [Gammaproteobacteria bacterium]